MSSQQQIHHLWAACSSQLQRALHNGGANNVTNPDVLLEDIRLLAVKRKNNLVNIVDLQRMGQANDETITQYSTLLMGHADVCDFFTECSACNRDISFIRGLADSAAQERILESAAQVEGGELTL